MPQEITNSLKRIYKGILSLSPMGANAVHRRALAIVADELENVSGSPSFNRCRPGREPHFNSKNKEADVSEGPFEFSEAYGELRQEDRRSSIFLDPQEAFAAKLVDYYSGRLDVLEVRGSPEMVRELHAASHVQAAEHLRSSNGIVSVLPIVATDRSELIDALRALAHALEKVDENFGVLKDLPDMEAHIMESCQLIQVEAGATRWSNNGRKLEQQYREVYSCQTNDGCCGNKAYTKHGAWVWRTVWEDDGETTNPPPVNPPPFQSYPWENRCAVFPSPVAARVSSDWGWRTINGQPNFHGGMDLAVPVGTQVLSASAGRVVLINNSSPNGETGIVIRSGDETLTYWHVDPDNGLSVGDQVPAGRVLGVTAAHPQPHLHFARHRPPNGDPGQRNDANSVSPCP